MPPREGFAIAHFLTGADIDRSARFYKTVFGGRVLSKGDKQGEIRCYIRDPDGYTIEVGQSK